MVSDAGLVLVGAVAAERLVELVLARRNAAWALARGGVESGRNHYPAMVLLHVCLIAGSAVEPVVAARPFDPLRFWLATAAIAVAQCLRWWTIATLGRRWNTRVIALPGFPLVTGGPFRFLRHPNYLAVAVEVTALPVAVGAWVTAVVATLLNALLMAVRIPCEETALGIRARRA